MAFDVRATSDQTSGRRLAARRRLLLGVLCLVGGFSASVLGRRVGLDGVGHVLFVLAVGTPLIVVTGLASAPERMRLPARDDVSPRAPR